ncbi:hypothetical protein GCM10028895_28820 [Pontibacter rugosus]
MASVNKVILIGNLGKDPEVRHLEGGVAVARFPIATSESFKDKQGQRQERTEWHNIVLWRGLAEVAEKYLKKEILCTLREDCAPITTRTKMASNATALKLWPTR